MDFEFIALAGNKSILAQFFKALITTTFMSYDDYHKHAIMLNLKDNLSTLRPFLRPFIGKELAKKCPKPIPKMSDEEFDAFLNDELSKDWIEGEMKIGEFTFKVRLRGVGKIPPNCNPPPEGYYLEFREKEELYEVVYTKGMQYLDKLKIKPDEYDWMGN